MDSETGVDFSRYLPLYLAAMRGEWETAKNFLEERNESAGSTIISSLSETVLHVAVSTKKANDMVKKLVDIIPNEALLLKDYNGDTALHVAAIVGNKEAAEALISKNPNLLFIRNNQNRLPVQVTVTNCQRETLEYLISQHKVELEPKPELHTPLFEGQLGFRLFVGTISSQFVDIALKLAHEYPNLALLRDSASISALSIIARKDALFPRTETFSWRQKFIYHLRQKLESMIWHVIENLVPQAKELREKKTRREQALQLAEFLCDQIISSEMPAKEASSIFKMSIEIAAEYGVSEIVEMIIRKYPMVGSRTIFELAAKNRYENVINLIYNMSDRKYTYFDHVDDDGNNLMHICGKLAPPHRLNLVAGAALQMQRELQWFKEMEDFVHPSRRTWTNNKGETPQMLFTDEHEKLKRDGEKWMKDTANACTIAAALIATVMFAAAFTVPGGVDSETGLPLFTGQGPFQLFVVADGISLFTSITSLLMFLSILTARYAEQDFLYVLPKRLSMGLLSLFVSVTFMLVAFIATLYLLLKRDTQWFVVVVGGFAFLPVTSFVLLQFPLLVDVIYSTYGPGIFGKKTDSFLY